MLEILSGSLVRSTSIYDKMGVLDALPKVGEFLAKHRFLAPFFAGLTPECEIALKQVIAIEQADRLFAGVNAANIDAEKLRALLEGLVAIDDFYREIGGIVGYQAKIMELLRGEEKKVASAISYHAPCFIDIAEETDSVREAVEWGIEGLARMAEIYPLGGAADRLHLVDEKTGTELPAAKLPFGGITLLERLIQDLQARELLYFQKYGMELITPIAIMTSHEKNNHAHVIEICETHNYFGRPKDSIRFFTQPLVPAVNASGDWCMLGPLKPLMKPGGHGAIWKLARDRGIFSWFESLGRKKALIRQINNPIAGLDYGLLAFTGIGIRNEMTFGFASCPRLLQAAEGVNVLVEKEKEIVLTNIEYCDFAKFGIEDLPLKEGEPYSRFSSNTNILFADLNAISRAVDACPFPGLLINLKKVSYTTESGEKKEEPIARLESTMQNIADVFVEEKGAELKTVKTFVTYNQRHKTISTAKKAFVTGGALQETPENCFFDLLQAHRELLQECGFVLPECINLQQYLERGPDFLFHYHPALGPLYSTIREKLCGGSLSLGSELFLEIADFHAKQLHITGSLRVFGTQGSRCILENVTIGNQGVDWNESRPYWKMALKRRETVTIILKGQGSFFARNLHLKGSHTFVIEDGQTMEI